MKNELDRQETNLTNIQNSIASEFPNVTLKELDIKNFDTTGIRSFNTINDFKTYLRESAIDQPYKLKSDSSLLNNQQHQQITKPTNGTSTYDESSPGTFIAPWSTTYTLYSPGEFPAFAIGMTAIVTYTASYQNGWIKKITEISPITVAGDQTIQVGLPLIAGSARYVSKNMGTQTNIIYGGYTAQVVSMIKITEYKTFKLAGRVSEVATEYLRNASPTISSQALPNPPPPH